LRRQATSSYYLRRGTSRRNSNVLSSAGYFNGVQQVAPRGRALPALDLLTVSLRCSCVRTCWDNCNAEDYNTLYSPPRSDRHTGTRPVLPLRIINERVCPSVCLSVCPLGYQKNYTSKLHQTLGACHPGPLLGHPLVASGSGIATGWTEVDMYAPLLLEVAPEIDTNSTSFYRGRGREVAPPPTPLYRLAVHARHVCPPTDFDLKTPLASGYVMCFRFRG